ncbi:MAG: bifunctional nuclease family protein [Bacteroidota bacterium]|nr:bifunctional nuclease family protein [Bacteroidota bacterium]MDP4227023.1 bifunctional nuclease family protein [Bacteroidota bacterium]MDP4273118.1 bifunctional nuclease family protein [Bacteroidota bacterium]
MNKVKLNVLGISYSQTQSGAYALVLSEENGERRIPIIVGGFEAQAIAIQLEGLNPPRPLTHDLFLNFAKAFKINLTEVNIYKLEEGVFYSKLICESPQVKLSVDARTSDAIALALRFKCPIYTTEEIISKAGIILDFEKESKENEESKGASVGSSNSDSSEANEFVDLDTQELKELLDESVKQENYERASLIRDELNKRKK